jgi:hypothetical protein
MTEISQPQSAFLRILPPEIRNKIYEDVVVDQNELIYPQGRNPATPPPITHVCSQVRSEALSLYYSANRFVLPTALFASQKCTGVVMGFMGKEARDTPNIASAVLGQWLDAIGPQNAKALRYLMVSLVDDLCERRAEHQLRICMTLGETVPEGRNNTKFAHCSVWMFARPGKEVFLPIDDHDKLAGLPVDDPLNLNHTLGADLLGGCGPFNRCFHTFIEREPGWVKGRDWQTERICRWARARKIKDELDDLLGGGEDEDFDEEDIAPEAHDDLPDLEGDNEDDSHGPGGGMNTDANEESDQEDLPMPDANNDDTFSDTFSDSSHCSDCDCQIDIVDPTRSWTFPHTDIFTLLSLVDDAFEAHCCCCMPHKHLYPTRASLRASGRPPIPITPSQPAFTPIAFRQPRRVHGRRMSFDEKTSTWDVCTEEGSPIISCECIRMAALTLVRDDGKTWRDQLLEGRAREGWMWPSNEFWVPPIH